MKILDQKQENIIQDIKIKLENGKVLVLPTDTVYGLFCDAHNKNAIKKIFAIKARSLGKPLGIFVKDVAMAKQYAKINSKQEKFLKNYWPGKVTFVLKKKTHFPEGVGMKDTIGIRIPNYDLFKKLFALIDFPLAQTSANLSGKPFILDANEVIKEFENRTFQPDLILDAGKLPSATPSAVIDLTNTTPQILRKGNGFDYLKNKGYK